MHENDTWSLALKLIALAVGELNFLSPYILSLQPIDSVRNIVASIGSLYTSELLCWVCVSIWSDDIVDKFFKHYFLDYY